MKNILTAVALLAFAGSANAWYFPNTAVKSWNGSAMSDATTFSSGGTSAANGGYATTISFGDATNWTGVHANGNNADTDSISTQNGGSVSHGWGNGGGGSNYKSLGTGWGNADFSGHTVRHNFCNVCPR